MVPDSTRTLIREYYSKRKPSVNAVARKFKLSWATAKAIVANTPRKPRSPGSLVAKRRRKVARLAMKTMKTVEGRTVPLYPTCAKLADFVGVHRSTVRRDLKSSGLVCRVRRKIPTVDPEVWQKRFRFCSEFKGAGYAGLTKILFTDEHTLSLNDHTSRTMWVKKGSTPAPRERRRMQNTSRIMVWGGVAVGCRTKLIILNENNSRKVDGALYKRRCLSSIVALAKERNLRVWQDNARPHLPGVPYLQGKGVAMVKNVPPYSPDLNAIECVWKLLNRKVAEARPTTLADLKRVAVREWNALPQKTLDQVCRGLKGAVERVVREKGGFF